jgi:1,4-dihydroxy-2-naphthoyl-CoA hydrolase
MTDEIEDYAAQVNEITGGFNRAMGLRFTRATLDEVIAELVISEEHLQPYGLVHGGVYAGMIESLCSTGAALHALPRGQSAVGQENTTAFLRAARKGVLRGRAVPIHPGRRSQVWQAEIRDDEGRLLATGRVRLLCLESGASAGGEEVALVTGSEP